MIKEVLMDVDNKYSVKGEAFMIRSLLCVVLLCLSACAGPNPNPGERTVDIAWERSDYNTIFRILRPAAERGEPWAQLRMGVAYELGVGVERDIPTAIKWYSLAAAQEADGNWANGLLVGAMGEAGYFNRNSDALVARYQLANIYLSGDGVSPDARKALELARYVSEKSEGGDIFYCCESSGGRYITQQQIATTLAAAQAAQ